MQNESSCEVTQKRQQCMLLQNSTISLNLHQGVTGRKTHNLQEHTEMQRLKGHDLGFYQIKKDI